MFVELYEEHGTKQAVAERVQWSRPTVSKWVDRRLEGVDSEEEVAETDTSGREGSMSEEEPQEGGAVSRAVPEDLMEEPEPPNDILLDIIDRDPKLGDDEMAYIKRFFEDYGQLSPSDLTDILSDLSINNKRMTIGRINRHYEKAINRKLRENPDLKYDERWATLLTKVTGDNHYIREAQRHDPYGGDLGGIQPPTGETRGSSDGMGGRGISPPAERGSTQPNRRGIQAPPSQPPQQQPQQPRQPAPQQQQPQGRDSLSPFEKRLLEMLEGQMGSETKPQPQPQPQQQPAEQAGAASQLDELLQLQTKMEELQERTGGDSGVDEEIQSIAEKFEARMAQLEQRIAESSNDPEPTPAQPRGDDGGDSMLSEIAMLADTVDDPEMLSMLIETQTDPEVLEARAKSKEVENETEWKKSLAESLSPAAAEKAIDAVLNMSSSLGGQQPQREPKGQRPQQAPRPQQPQTSPQQRQQQPQATQPPNSPEGGVEVVDEDRERNARVQNGRKAAAQANGSPPLRQDGEMEIQETNNEDSGEGGDDMKTEADEDAEE